MTMKQKLGFLFILLVGCIKVMHAAPVSEDAAKRKAVAFINNNAQQRKTMRGTMQDKRTFSGSDLTLAESCAAYYVFNLPYEEGYVIVSGDDCLPEVLGYSKSGQFIDKNIPENMRAWMEGYVSQYEYLQSHPEEKVTAQDTKDRVSIEPLIKCKYDQNTPYNNKCPVINNKKAATGCVATAMAQIMYFYQWPEQTTDTIPEYFLGTIDNDMPAIPITKIDWDHILNHYSLRYDSLQADAISTLMLLCGTSVKMTYDGQSSSSIQSAADAFRRYFGYSEQTEYVERDWFSPEQWEQVVYDELISGRPVLYIGFSTGGHAFVVDGYQSGYFHVNFGWRGSGDGYFIIPYLGEFTSSHAAVINLQPINDKYANLYSVLDNGTMKIYYDKEKKNRQGTVLVKSDWKDHTGEIYECVIDSSFSDFRPVSLKRFFEGMWKVKAIKGLENINTSYVKDMSYMFSGCFDLPSLDLSNFETSGVMNMCEMFSHCYAMSSLDLSNFNTSNVKDMSYMFHVSYSLPTLDLSSFDTSNVKDMSGMFGNCSGLTNLDLGNFDTSNVINMNSMFSHCRGLIILDLSSFDTSNVRRMYEMFNNCNSLTTIYVDEYKWSTINVTSGKDMFGNCFNLVGGNGTVYSYDHADSEYAQVDKEGAVGYFTQKTGTGIQLPTTKWQKGDIWYTLDGRKLFSKPSKKGVYILNGKMIINH